MGLRIEERKPVPPHASPTDPFSTCMPNMDGPAGPAKDGPAGPAKDGPPNGGTPRNSARLFKMYHFHQSLGQDYAHFSGGPCRGLRKKMGIVLP